MMLGLLEGMILKQVIKLFCYLSDNEFFEILALCKHTRIHNVEIIVENYFRLFRSYSFKKVKLLDIYQTSIIHDLFTSHTKVHLLVRYGSGNTLKIYQIICITMFRSIHHYEYLSNRMDLLCLVSLTPVRWPSIVLQVFFFHTSDIIY